VTEVRAALLDGRADLAVHSSKDLPTEPLPDLVVAAVPRRADPRDVLVSRTGQVFGYLPAGARIGTGSRRRAAQLLRRRGDVVIVELRGNVDTRLAKVAAGEVDAVVLAAAGLERLGRLAEVTEFFDPDQMIPAPGQGALALEARAGDRRVLKRLDPLHDARTAYAVTAERTCLAALGGGCHTPVAVFATTDGELMHIHGLVATPDGSHAARLRWSGPSGRPEEVGRTLAELLLAAGGREILAGGPLPPTIRYAERHTAELADDWPAPYPWEEA
jgi:hydroxymethylbilane synthase